MEIAAPKLLKIQDAARQLGVPAAALEREAERHGFLVVIGSAKRIPASDLEELVNKCRVKAKVPDCIIGTEERGAMASTSFAMAKENSQRAQEIVQRLKQH